MRELMCEKSEQWREKPGVLLLLLLSFLNEVPERHIAIVVNLKLRHT